MIASHAATKSASAVDSAIMGWGIHAIALSANVDTNQVCSSDARGHWPSQYRNIRQEQFLSGLHTSVSTYFHNAVCQQDIVEHVSRCPQG